MWSTEVIANGFNQVPAPVETSLDDLDEIEFNFHGVKSHGKSDKSLPRARDRNGNHTELDEYSRFKHGSDLNNKMTLQQSLSLPDASRNSEESMISVTNISKTTRTVEITRNSKDPLGFFIRQGDGNNIKTGIYISRVTKGSLVDCHNLLKVGDEILNINGVDVKRFCLMDAVELIQATTRLIMTLRTLNRSQGSKRPGIYTRHSSPSLFKGIEKDLQSPIHSKNNSGHLMTNPSLKDKQKEPFSDKLNANDFDCSDLSKNTSTIEELIRLLRAHTEEQTRLQEEERENPTPGKNLYHVPENDRLDSGNLGILTANTNGYEPKKASTITPTTTVDLVFDDDDDMAVASQSQLGNPNTTANNPRHPYHRVSVTKSPENPSLEPSQSLPRDENMLLNVTRPRSRTSSHGSSSGGSSPRPRRRLPSLPTEDMLKNRKGSTSSLRSLPDSKPRRKLPSQPSSPLEGSHLPGQKVCQSPGQKQKIFSWGGPESGSLTDIKGLISDWKINDSNTNKSAKEKSSSRRQSYQVTGEGDKYKQQDHPRGSVDYQRRQSQHSDFYDQQRHSMFLQTVTSGQTLIASTRSSGSLSLSFDGESDAESAKSDVMNCSSGSAILRLKSRESSPIMRRHASSSLLFRKSRDTSPATTRGKVESDPGFKLFPNDFKDIDLSCSHAVSGLMKARIIKAVNLNSIDKKKYKKIFCAIEVDFERKACTSQKKISRNPSWDEVFDVEIQHGREMTFLCYGSKKEFDKPIARASFFLTPLVRQSQTHQIVVRLAPEGLLYMELEFTEIKTLLKRTPSSKNSGVFGCNLSVTSQQERSTVPLIVRKCVDEIEKRGLDSVGLYRISGNARKKEELKAQFEENSQEADISVDNCPDIHVVTGILKDYLRELPEPLVTERMSQQLLMAINENVQEREPAEKKKILLKLLSDLSESNRHTLVFILAHLCRVLNNIDNKMDCRNLSVCLAPVLQYSPSNLSQPKDLLGLRTFLKAVEVLIEMWNDVERMDCV